MSVRQGATAPPSRLRTPPSRGGGLLRALQRGLDRGGAPLSRLSARAWVALAVVATLLAHLLFLSRDLHPDEGGFAMVARAWHLPGPYLYGTQWVDRPPGLVLVFDAANLLGPYGVRLTAALVATVLVAAAALAGRAVRGGRGAVWAAWTAFALASSPLLDAYQLNGELIAAALVTVSVALLLTALVKVHRPGVRLLLTVGSGMAAGTAPLVKQNFADALVFAAVLLVATLVLRPGRAAEVWRAALAFGVGVAVPIAAALAWAASTAGVPELLYAMFGFRADAMAVMAAGSLEAPQSRLVQLVGLAAASGLLVLAAQLVVGNWRSLLDRRPLVLAVVAAGVLELVGIVSGANFWAHYLIGLVPMVALAAALGATGPSGRWTRALVVATAASTTVVALVVGIGSHANPSTAYRTARWLAESSAPADTVVVPFTHANVIEESGLSSPYPYSWSLPLRTLDPKLSLLVETLRRPQGAPTWVVRWDSPHPWGLDPGDKVDLALRRHYRQVAEVCGHPVWLHRGVQRSLAPEPSGCSGEVG